MRIDLYNDCGYKETSGIEKYSKLLSSSIMSDDYMSPDLLEKVKESYVSLTLVDKDTCLIEVIPSI